MACSEWLLWPTPQAIEVASGTSDKPEVALFNGVVLLLKLAAKDRVGQVFFAALELQEKLLDNPPSSLSPKSIADGLRPFMDATVLKVQAPAHSVTVCRKNFIENSLW